MTTAIVILAVVMSLIGYFVSARLITRVIYLAERQTCRSLYDDSSYRYRDSPHAEDALLGYLAALVFPVSLPIVLMIRLAQRRQIIGRQRWERQRQQRLEAARAQRRQQEIVAELNGQHPVDDAPRRTALPWEPMRLWDAYYGQRKPEDHA